MILSGVVFSLAHFETSNMPQIAVTILEIAGVSSFFLFIAAFIGYILAHKATTQNK